MKAIGRILAWARWYAQTPASVMQRVAPVAFAATLLLGTTAAGETLTEPPFTVEGLRAPAEILVDEWGVPHIYASDHYDAFLVQGFNAARDRLWQIDLWRRRGLGLLAEVLGPNYVEQDRAARLFLYRGDMYREWLAYGSDAKRVAEAFVAGINAYVELVSNRTDLMPPEFRLLGYAPARWQAADVVRIRSHGLWRNVDAEVTRARIACGSSLERAELWHVLEPSWRASVPAGLDPCDVPERVLDVYHLATAPVAFNPPGTSAANARNVSIVSIASTASTARTARTARARERVADRSIGSNNWVVAPARSATGRAILADDPHRAHAVPSLRYVSHLVAPGLDVIGAGEPALPGISIGHNQDIAFGLTIFPVDQEDLYVYEKLRGGYRYQGRTEPFTEIEEAVPLADGSARVHLRFTRHGPVVHETRTRAYAVRAAWLTAGMAPYFGSIEYMRAANWREFTAALNRWGAPSENQVFADTTGNIGYKPAGLFPKRDNWDGLLPVPGDGRYEWDGFFDMDVLPEEFNPARGFTGTANSMTLPADYPIDRYRIGFEWSAPWRYVRLMEVLAGQPVHRLEDSLALQRDYTSVLARRALDILPNDPPDDPHPARAMLARWDGTLGADSAAAALWAVWYHRHLVPALISVLAPGAGLPGLDTRTVLAALAQREHGELVSATLAAAWEETHRLLGPDPQAWQWGKLHQIRFEHPLLAHAPPDLAARMRYPAYPRGGSANTTNNTGFSAGDFLVASGASFRMVLDVGNWDAALMTNAPGQSGDPRSPFYGNLLEGWAMEASFPLVYTREAVERHTVQRYRLEPRER